MRARFRRPRKAPGSLLPVATVLALVILACQPSSPPAAGEAAAPARESAGDSTADWQTPLLVDEDFDPATPLRAGFLVVDGVFNSELMAPYDIFHHTPPHTAPAAGIEVFVVSPDGKPITTYEGLEIAAHHSFASAPPIDILVVASAEHSMDSDLENQEMLDWVARVSREARYVLSLCDGAFVLAAAGVLDGRAVTTFPGDLDRFEERFPHLDVRRGVSFVHDRNTITSSGGSLSYDPAIYLVAHLYGDEAAQRVGTGLLIDWPPGDLQATLLPEG